MIPGQPNTLLLAQALFVGFCVLHFLMRRLPFKIRITELEILIIIITLCVVQAYARNPVGLNIFGGSSIGGRPYMIYAITLVTSLLLAFLNVSATDLRWILRLSIIGGLINFVMSAIGFFIPRVGVWYGSVELNSLDSSIVQDGQYEIDRATRVEFVRDIANNIALWISAFKSPLRACFNPLWSPLVLLSFAFAAISGYRNEIGAVGLTYLVGIAYRGGFYSLFNASIAVIIAIVFLAFLNQIAPLPSNIQRALSFLPGTWDDIHVQDSKDSTEWRMDMWKEALLTDYWIKNKWLGDGLGMTQEEFNYIQSFKNKQIGGRSSAGKLTLGQEFMMASNAYHSGPVSTIRTIGYVGLAILIIAQIRLAVHSHRQIQRTRKTEWLPLTLLIGIPNIWAPFFFIFIFGDFGPALGAFLGGAAMIRILENNLPLPAYVKRKRDRVLNSPSTIEG